jgi:hypothetical protein
MGEHQSGPPLTRREALRRVGGGFGMVGLASMLPQLAASEPPSAATLLEHPPHFPARAKHIIFLFLNGGLSQVDSFDPKPALAKYHGQPLPGGNPKTERRTGNLMRSPFTFQHYGESGIEVSELFPHIGSCADDICFLRSVQTDIPNHEPSLLMMNNGHIQPGRPSLGAWTVYGLGTQNRNLPGFIVLCPEQPSVVGPPLWGSAFLPAVFQGSYISSKETDPHKQMAYLQNDSVSEPRQRKELDLLAKLNRLQMENEGYADPQLESTIASMEIAFRMQTEAPDVFDLSKESEATRKLYGDTDFARSCLMARRLVQRGVRVVQIYFARGNPWDHHDDIEQHRKNALRCDQAIGGLIRDLKSHGLLDETLVFLGTEFGRTPVVETSAGFGGDKVQNGRDHNPYGFTVCLAGGGIKGGATFGATDEFGFHAVDNPVHVHDVHATILHAMGLKHERLTYRFSGRDYRLTDVSGNVIKQILA